RNTSIAFHGRGPGDDASRDCREVVAAPDDRHRRRRGVEDADQACNPMTGDVVQTCVSGRRLLRARLKQKDALVLVAAVDVDVAATLEVQASRGVSATRNEEFHRANGPGGRARHVVAGGGVDAVPLIREVTARRSGGGGIPARESGPERHALLIRRRGLTAGATVDRYARVSVSGIGAVRQPGSA